MYYYVQLKVSSSKTYTYVVLFINDIYFSWIFSHLQPSHFYQVMGVLEPIEYETAVSDTISVIEPPLMLWTFQV